MTATTSHPNLARRLGVEVGSIFSRSWGYDETHVNYYVVTSVTPSGKSVRLREVGLTTVEDSGSYTTVVPDLSRTTDKVTYLKRLRENSFQDGATVNWNSYSDAYLWTGGAQYQTGQGWGH